MVKLTDIPEIAERYASYINANYINVRISTIHKDNRHPLTAIKARRHLLQQWHL